MDDGDEDANGDEDDNDDDPQNSKVVRTIQTSNSWTKYQNQLALKMFNERRSQQ